MILEVDEHAIHVATGHGSLAILEVQPEGKRAMHARDFVAGHLLSPGDVFSSS